VQPEEVLSEDLLEVRAMAFVDRGRRLVLGGRQGVEAGDGSAHEKAPVGMDVLVSKLTDCRGESNMQELEIALFFLR
jgi:hypothetical protein